jgi:glutamate formiminotransferase/formiminotetrahydrofolate cyclodeaminase
MTEGNEKYRGSWADMERVRREAGEQETLLRRLVDEDTEAFLAVMAARKLPRSTPQEQAARAQALQAALARSAGVPASTLAAIRALSGLARLAAERGNPACITDAGTAAVMLRAGAAAAAWNVRINLASLDDAALREKLDRRTGEDLLIVLEHTGKTEQLVDSRLAGPALPG